MVFYPWSKTFKAALTCTWRRTDACRCTSILTVKYCLVSFLRCLASTLHNSHGASKNAVKTDSEASKNFKVFLVWFGFFPVGICMSFIYSCIFLAEFKLIGLQQFFHPFHPSWKVSICPSPRTSPTLSFPAEISYYGSRIIWGSKHPSLKLPVAQQEQRIWKLQADILQLLTLN